MAKHGRKGSFKRMEQFRESEAYRLQELNRLATRPGGFDPHNRALVVAQLAMSKTMPLMGTVGKQLDLMTGIRADLWRWIDEYENREKAPGEGYELFKHQWKLLRLGVGLQARLLVEQILWDKGNPWRELITGFGAIEG